MDRLRGNILSYRQVINWLAMLLVIITPVSVEQWLRIGFSLAMLKFSLYFIFLFFLLYYIFFYCEKEKIRGFDRKLITVYLIWIVICIVRGCFVASDYWQWKNLVGSSFALLLPLFCFFYSDATATHRSLRVWFPWASLMLVFVMMFLSRGAIVFYVGPFLLIGCLLPLVPNEWRWPIILLFFVMLFIDFGARSQMIKAAVSIAMSMLYMFRKMVPFIVVKFAHALMCILPVVLLLYGISGNQDVFSLFEDASTSVATGSADMSTRANIEEFGANTRSFLYMEVITSAVNNGYVICGRTPARGNDSAHFGEKIAIQLQVNRYERPENEVGFLNVFTWTGLIGLILYCLIFLRAAWLGVFRSRNIPMKIVGLFAAFHFMFGFVEDCNRFDIQNISIWMGLAMCLSEEFRAMSDREFIEWFKTLFVVVVLNKNSWNHTLVSRDNQIPD